MAKPLLIRTFSHHCREKYGSAVGKIPLHLGYSCPNRENGGCIYCLAPSFTPGYLNHSDGIDTQIAEGKKHLLKGRFTRYFAYFQQETTTAAPQEQLLSQLANVLGDDACIGCILSTRPDYLDNQLLVELAELVSTFGKECLIELGLQTIHEDSLKLLNRNHSYTDFSDAVHRIRKFTAFEIGAHLILGIPNETESQIIQTVLQVSKLGIDALKLHHLQVIKNTHLEQLYKKGKIEVFHQREYLSLLIKLLPLIPQKVVIHRLWATSHPNLLVAPKWHVLATELSRILRTLLAEKNLYQGKHWLSK